MAKRYTEASDEDIEDKIRRFIGIQREYCEDEKDYEEQVAADMESWERIRKLFSAASWHHAVHRCIGDIVRNNRFNTADHLHPKHKELYFRWYSLIVNNFVGCVCTPEGRFASIVLRTLGTQKALDRNKKYSGDHTSELYITEEDAMCVLATYNLEYFGYLLSRFEISFKESCLDLIKKQLLGLAEKKPSEGLSEQIEEFVSKQSTNLSDQHKKINEGIEKLFAKNEYLDVAKVKAPLSLISSQEFIPKAMQPVPSDPKLWDEYLLQMCNARLDLILKEEKNQSEEEFESFHFKSFNISHLGNLERGTAYQLKKINKLLNPTPELWKNLSRPQYIRYFREDLSTLIYEKLHYIHTELYDECT